MRVHISRPGTPASCDLKVSMNSGSPVRCLSTSPLISSPLKSDFVCACFMNHLSGTTLSEQSKLSVRARVAFFPLSSQSQVPL